MTIPFYLVDVFATQRYGGNQLAVFDARKCSADALNTDQMQAIAREINFQETTFILGGSLETGFDVRIFTPEYEVPFAGHPTLGTAWVLAHELVGSGPIPLTLNLGVGSVPVRWQSDSPWFTATQPRFGPTFDRAGLARLLHLSTQDIDDGLPIERVSTGLFYVIVPVNTLEAMRRVRIDVNEFEAWLLANNLHKTNSPERLHTSLYVFSRETYSPANQLNARMFCFEQGKVAEDPATGSAGSCLLAYGLKHSVLGAGTLQAHVEQGYEVGRPSRLHLDGSLTGDGKFSLNVGGQVQYVATGVWG